MAIVIVVAVSIFQRQQNVPSLSPPESNGSVQSVTDSTNDSSTGSLTESPSPQPTPTSSPTTQEISSSNPDSIATDLLTSLYYPASTQISTTSSSLVLESQADPTAITDWYQDQIKSQGFSTTSFVKTSTNGNVLNKLVAANSSTHIEVEITKHEAEQQTSISVTIK